MTFETMINEALRKGESIDDIVSKFTNAVNAAQEKNKSAKERKDYLDQLTTTVTTMANKHQWTPKMICSAATLMIADRYKEWDKKQLASYEATLEEMFDTTGEVANHVFHWFEGLSPKDMEDLMGLLK